MRGSARGRFHAVLELAHLVVARAHGLVALFDDRPTFAVQHVRIQRCLELLLEIILAALDFVDDRLFILAGDRGFQILEPLVRLAEE